eukprot:3573575-Pyramimonas_sp.AAC.1
MQAVDTSGGSRPNQYCMTLEMCFTKDQQAALEAANSDSQMAASKMGSVMYKLGMVCPSEQLLKRAGAI